MKRWLRSKLVGLARKMASSRFGQSLLHERKTQSFKSLDKFVDSKGNEFQRLDGYRDLIVPRWPGMFVPQPDPPVVTKNEIVGSRTGVAETERFLQIHGFSLVGAEVLEVGCHGGTHAYAMAELGASHVDGIDVPEYGVRENHAKEVNTEAIGTQSRWLKALRQKVLHLYEVENAGRGGAIGDNVELFDMDIAILEKTNAYDAIISWATLEHITKPETAIKNMYNALRPGGICWHVYNPFFGIDGGHSLCTLDFPYGHVRLSAADFEGYIRTYRPEEFRVAMNFYQNSLGRLTMSDLCRYCEKAGFRILSMIAWPNNDDLQSLDKTILSQCRDLYPTITVCDLISVRIQALFVKPNDKS